MLERVLATVLFTDIVDSTHHASEHGDHAWQLCNAPVDRPGAARPLPRLGDEHHRRRLLRHLRRTRPRHPLRLRHRRGDAPLGIQIRAGLHTGEVQLVGDKAEGMAVNIGARVCAQAGASEVLVSHTVKDLVAGSGLHFHDLGDHDLKGVPDSWHLFRLVDE